MEALASNVLNWVSNMWSQATLGHYRFLPLNEYGWKISDSELRIDWDDATNMEQVRKAVQMLLKGCSCKKGCKTRRCGCLKDGRKCGPGCSCSNCENSLTGTAPTAREEIDDEVETEEMQEDQALRDQYASYLVDDNECDEVDMFDELDNDDGYTDER